MGSTYLEYMYTIEEMKNRLWYKRCILPSTTQAQAQLEGELALFSLYMQYGLEYEQYGNMQYWLGYMQYGLKFMQYGLWYIK